MTKKIRFTLILLAFFTYDAYGYVDPGTGSYLIQIILAGIVGASLGIRVFWSKIKSFFAGSKNAAAQDNSDEKKQQ